MIKGSKRALALLALIPVVAAACGSSKAAPATTAAPAATTAAPATTAAAATTAAPATTAAAAAPAAAKCPNGDSVNLFAPYEANQPAGVNWRTGIEMAVGEVNAKGGILGCKIAIEFKDTNNDPNTSKQVVAAGVEKKPYAIMGTVFSASTIINMVEAQRAEIPQFVGAEAPNITDRTKNNNNDYIFRTSFGGNNAAPKLVGYMKAKQVKSVDVIYKNDEFGKGGADAHVAAMEAAGITVGEKILVQPDQADQSAEVSKLSAAKGDAVFVYMTEKETGTFLNEVQKQGFKKQLYGGDVLTAAATLKLVNKGAGDGAISHSGLNAAAPVFKDWKAAYAAAAPKADAPDHNSFKGYSSIYFLKVMTERNKAFDSKALAKSMKCAKITTADEPKILLNIQWDANGDMNRDSFIVAVKDGVGTISDTAPAFADLSKRGC